MFRSDDIRIKQLNPAAERGDLDEVKIIIEENKNLLPNSLTIAKAIISGNLELLKYFQDKFSISPTIVNTNDMNYAIRNMKSSDMFKHLITSYRGIRFGFNNETTWIVARSANLENLKLLLSVRIPQADSGTLFEAVNSGNLDCVKFLVEDYKIDGELVITDYEEALKNAKEKKLDDIAAYLQDRMPKQIINPIEIIDSSAIKLSKPSTQQQPSSNIEEHELLEACKNFRSGDVKRLLDKGVSPNIRDTEGNTPLFYAAINSDFDSVDHLCTAGADVNLKNNNEETPLIYAYQKRHSEIPLQLLLSKGANPYIQLRSGRTLFVLAKEAHRIVELGSLQEWEMDNSEIAKKFRIETENSERKQASQSAILAKPFITSPIHTAQSLPVKKEEKITAATKSEQNNINLILGHLQIIFGKTSNGVWQLEVLNNGKSIRGQYPMILSSKESIDKIQTYLQEENISALIEFIGTKGFLGNKMSQYLQEEIKNMDLKKFKF